MRLQVTCEDRLGLTRELLAQLEVNQIDLRGIEIDVAGIIYLHLPDVDFANLQKLLPDLRRITGVTDVKTVAYMPSEREHHEIKALMKALPDLVFALDIKGRLTQANDAVLNILRLSLKDIQGVQAGSFLKGFAFLQWFASGNPQPETCKLIFASEEFLADILPILIPDSQGIDHLAGAVVVLKSARRVGHHFNLLHSYDDSSFEYFCAESQLMQQLLHQARRFAMQDQPLLIMGETGSGKEMLVRACHRASLRANGPLLTLNCAALPDDVAEHELFGSAAGAFGPDWPGKMGLLEQASGGAFLLDEVAEMSPLLQSKLLRVLQDGRFHRVGQESEVAVDVRLYCTTRKSLAEQVRKGLFREDLFFRLNVLTLEMPTLRQRLTDIMPLAQQFCSRISDELQRRRPRFSRSMTEFLNSYPWPGNVRQLKNALYQALTLLEGEELTPDMLRLPLMDAHESAAEQWFEGSLPEATKRFERLMLERLYPLYPSSRQLAQRLGLSHTAVANKLRDYGLNKTDAT
jgi:transcriptional regulator of aroF, aroG, tyrA and aromatic amino acid transport